MANAVYEKRREHMFPRLAPAQIARLEAHGSRTATQAGEVLVEAGERADNLLVVLEGELSTLRGVPGFTRITAREDGAVLAIEPECLRDVVQTDAELSEILMRAFILRRMGLVASERAGVTLVGSRHSAETLRLREFLTRNAHPYVSVDVEGDSGVQELLDRFHVGIDEVPVLIGGCGRVFRNPSVGAVAEYLGMNPAMDEAAVCDLVVVGAGPAGLSAAV